jgi:hypothetical protein
MHAMQQLCWRAITYVCNKCDKRAKLLIATQESVPFGVSWTLLLSFICCLAAASVGWQATRSDCTQAY